MTAGVDVTGVDREWVEAQLSRFDLLRRTLVEPEALARSLLLELAPLVGAAQGVVYSTDAGGTAPRPLLLRASYAAGAGLPERVPAGEGLLGQCALEQRKLIVRGVAGEHFRVRSALGSSVPHQLAFVPVWLGETTLGVVELGFAGSLSATREALLDQLAERGPRPEPASPERVVSPPRGLRSGRSRSGHPHGFWGKLSHDLRSPLNSVLVLSQLLSDNRERNLSAKQVAFAKAIHASGNQLLALINTISDLSRIEANRLVLEPTEMSLEHFKAHLEHAFQPEASDRGLEFGVELAPGLPPTLTTDVKRLRQIMKCLLSNAFKFTESGRVSVNVSLAGAGWSGGHERLNNAPEVVAFSIHDTGVGLSESEQRTVLQASPLEQLQARRGRGGSGLGLAISRELGRLLGGELRVSSVVGVGSTFTLYLPTCGVVPSASSEERAAEGAVPSWPAPAPLGGPGRGRGDGEHREAPEALRGTELEGLSLVLVADDVRSAFTLTGVLERQGAVVSHAEDVREALERFGGGGAVSALVVDAERLTPSSEEPLRHLLERRGRVPVIALTSLARPPTERVAALLAEVTQLAKPVDPAELVSLLRRAVAQAQPLQR